jgi:hypothetical protein
VVLPVAVIDGPDVDADRRAGDGFDLHLKERLQVWEALLMVKRAIRFDTSGRPTIPSMIAL